MVGLVGRACRHFPTRGALAPEEASGREDPKKRSYVGLKKNP